MNNFLKKIAVTRKILLSFHSCRINNNIAVKIGVIFSCADNSFGFVRNISGHKLRAGSLSGMVLFIRIFLGFVLKIVWIHWERATPKYHCMYNKLHASDVITALSASITDAVSHLSIIYNNRSFKSRCLRLNLYLAQFHLLYFYYHDKSK